MQMLRMQSIRGAPIAQRLAPARALRTSALQNFDHRVASVGWSFGYDVRGNSATGQPPRQLNPAGAWQQQDDVDEE